MPQPMQKMIVTATATKDGAIHVDLDFYPRLPSTTEQYNQLSRVKQGLVSIINHIGKVNEKMVNGLIKMEKEDAVLPLPQEIQNTDSGSETQTQLPFDVPAKEEQDENTAG